MRQGRGYGPYHELTYDTNTVKLLGYRVRDSDSDGRSSDTAGEHASGVVLDSVSARWSGSADGGSPDSPVNAASAAPVEALKVGTVPAGYEARVREYHRWVIRSRKRFYLFTPFLGVLCFGLLHVGFGLPVDSVGGIVGRLVGVVGGLMFVRRVYCEFEF
jgi:hypothetical protein